MHSGPIEEKPPPKTYETRLQIRPHPVASGCVHLSVEVVEDDGSVVATVTGYSLVENGTRLETVQTMIDRINGTFAPALPTNPPTGNK